jgi:hypothetical protein
MEVFVEIYTKVTFPKVKGDDELNALQKEDLGIKPLSEDYLTFLTLTLIPFSNIRCVVQFNNKSQGCIIYLYEPFVDDRMEIITPMNIEQIGRAIVKAQRALL